MSTSKHIDKICCTALLSALLITFLLSNIAKSGVLTVSAAAGYESRLFNTAVVHTVDIVMDDWDSFLENCTDEKYVDCTVIMYAGMSGSGQKAIPPSLRLPIMEMTATASK